MQVYYEMLGGETLCFTHAVKAVMEDNETVNGYVDRVSPDSDDSMAGMVSPCCRCFPEDEEPEEEEDD